MLLSKKRSFAMAMHLSMDLRAGVPVCHGHAFKYGPVGWGSCLPWLAISMLVAHDSNLERLHFPEVHKVVVVVDFALTPVVLGLLRPVMCSLYVALS